MQTGAVVIGMAPLKQPRKLSLQTKEYVKDWIISLIADIAENDQDGKYDIKTLKLVEDIRDYVEPWMPTNLASKIIEEIFNAAHMHTSMKFAALQILNFPERTTKLVLGSMRETHYETLSMYLKSNCASIDHLNVRGIWFQDKSKSTFIDALRRMPRLEHLSVPYITNGAMLETISRKCAHLKTIDLSGSNELCETEILLLTNLRATLQLVNLGHIQEKNISSMGVAKLINALPNLVSLGSYLKTGEAINHLCKEMKRSHPTKLKYLHDQNTDFESLGSIQKLCPDLCSIFLNDPIKNLVKHLTTFKRLFKLKLSKVSAEDIHEMLEQNNGNWDIRHLEFVCLRESLDLTKIARFCPNLRFLEIFYSMSVHVSCPFNIPSLQKLTIYCTEIRGFDAQQDILVGCPNVQKLTLCQCDQLDDELLLNMLTCEALKHCEELCFLQAPGLTSEAIRYLLMTLDK